MKHLPYIFASVLLLSLTTGCAKKRCYVCDVSTAGILSKEEFCDRGEKEIRDMERTVLETKAPNGTVIYVTTFSNCTEQ